MTLGVIMSNSPITFLCLASEHKGDALIHELKRQGAQVYLVTEEEWREENWPRDSLDDIFFVPDMSKSEDVLNGVAYLARDRWFDRIVALDDYDVRLAALLREHMRLPGMNSSVARYFRDKLAMRQGAANAGIAAPPFVHILNHKQVSDYMDRVPAPWMLKPRFEAGAVGIKKAHIAQDVWRAIDELGDQQSYYLLEQFVPGDVYHVDAIMWEGEMVFAAAHKYGRPPMNVSHEGGVFITRTLDHDGAEATELKALTQQLLAALGMTYGVAHTEYIRHADGRYHFLETAARVGGAHIAETVEAATGVNLWAEWARLELAHARGEAYQLPPHRYEYAGVLICLARQEWPDLSAYNDPEVVWRVNKAWHAGLIVASPDAGRIEQLIEGYGGRFARDFLAVAQPKEAQRMG
jgi:glutathione synthase/RimK-type ligase-like ATP-grasp enzyme